MNELLIIEEFSYQIKIHKLIKILLKMRFKDDFTFQKLKNK